MLVSHPVSGAAFGNGPVERSANLLSCPGRRAVTKWASASQTSSVVSPAVRCFTCTCHRIVPFGSRTSRSSSPSGITSAHGPSGNAPASAAHAIQAWVFTPATLCAPWREDRKCGPSSDAVRIWVGRRARFFPTFRIKSQIGDRFNRASRPCSCSAPTFCGAVQCSSMRGQDVVPNVARSCRSEGRWKQSGRRGVHAGSVGNSQVLICCASAGSIPRERKSSSVVVDPASRRVWCPSRIIHIAQV